MTVTATARRAAAAPVVIADKIAASIAATPCYAFKGKMAALRNTALQGLASLAFVEGKSRADVISQLRIALGKSPTPADVSGVALEYVVGRVAAKLPHKEGETVAASLAFARQIVTQYAAPAKDGVKAKALRKGQISRRSPEQHKAVRAAEGQWYLVNAELGYGASQTQADKNKRQAAAAGSTKRGKVATAAPTHTELVAGPKLAANADESAAMVMQLASSLFAYANKNAATLPTEYGMSIKRFHGAIAALAKARVPADAIK